MIDYEKLRENLKNYFSIAMYNDLPAAITELNKVEQASNEQLINIAINYNLNDYTKEQIKKYKL